MDASGIEDKLLNDIALMFFDSQTVRSESSSYARAAIAEVRRVDKAKRNVLSGEGLERFLQDDSGLPS